MKRNFSGFHRIDTLDLPEGQPVRGWLPGLSGPLAKSLRTESVLADGRFKAIYQKRWKVETFHKTLKGNAALAKSPTKTVRSDLGLSPGMD